MAERRPYKADVAGSSPAPPTIFSGFDECLCLPAVRPDNQGFSHNLRFLLKKIHFSKKSLNSHRSCIKLST